MRSSLESSKPIRTSYRTQYLAAFGACIGALSLGSVIGYSSPASLDLLVIDANSTDVTTDTGPLKIHAALFMWFASSPNLGAVAGGIMGGISSNALGRRMTMLVAVAPFLLGWLLIGTGQQVWVLVLGRTITGIGMGFACTAGPPYIAEVASPEIRGRLSSGFQIMLTSGILYSFIFGSALQWRWLACACAAPPILYLIIVFLTPDSPSSLLSKGKEKDATNALQYFRGSMVNVQLEIEQMKEAQQKAKKVTMKGLTHPQIFRPLLICLALMVFQQMSGLPAVVFNLATIFRESGSTSSSSVNEIIIGAVQVIVTISSIAFIDRAGRKFLLILSSAVMALSIVSLGVYFFLREQNAEWTSTTLEWLPLTSLIILITAFSIGLGPVPWVMMGELLPLEVRELAASMATAVNWTSAFIATVIFLPLKTAIGDHGLYWFYGVICVLSLVFSIMVVPETKGKTLAEIATYFSSTSSATPKLNLRMRSSNMDQTSSIAYFEKAVATADDESTQKLQENSNVV